MGINAISGNASTLPIAATPGTETSVALTPQQHEVIQPTNDSVKLSGQALAKSLKLSGQTPDQIALKMGVDIRTVDRYLGVSAQAAANTPLQTKAATPQPYSPTEEVTESASQKTTETQQGKMPL